MFTMMIVKSVSGRTTSSETFVHCFNSTLGISPERRSSSLPDTKYVMQMISDMHVNHTPALYAGE